MRPESKSDTGLLGEILQARVPDEQVLCSKRHFYCNLCPDPVSLQTSSLASRRHGPQSVGMLWRLRSSIKVTRRITNASAHRERR